MTKCPHCNKDLNILPRCYINVDEYSPHQAVARTECCGQLVNLVMRRSYEISKYRGKRKEDDWGMEVGKTLED